MELACYCCSFYHHGCQYQISCDDQQSAQVLRFDVPTQSRTTRKQNWKSKFCLLRLFLGMLRLEGTNPNLLSRRYGNQAGAVSSSSREKNQQQKKFEKSKKKLGSIYVLYICIFVMYYVKMFFFIFQGGVWDGSVNRHDVKPRILMNE